MGRICVIITMWILYLYHFSERNEKIMIVTEDTIIGDVLDADADTAPYFLEIGMHCLGCPASRGESIADACAVHGTDAAELVAALNKHFGN